MINSCPERFNIPSATVHSYFTLNNTLTCTHRSRRIARTCTPSPSPSYPLRLGTSSRRASSSLVVMASVVLWLTTATVDSVEVAVERVAVADAVVDAVADAVAAIREDRRLGSSRHRRSRSQRRNKSACSTRHQCTDTSGKSCPDSCRSTPCHSPPSRASRRPSMARKTRAAVEGAATVTVGVAAARSRRAAAVVLGWAQCPVAVAGWQLTVAAAAVPRVVARGGGKQGNHRIESRCRRWPSPFDPPQIRTIPRKAMVVAAAMTTRVVRVGVAVATVGPVAATGVRERGVETQWVVPATEAVGWVAVAVERVAVADAVADAVAAIREDRRLGSSRHRRSRSQRRSMSACSSRHQRTDPSGKYCPDPCRSTPCHSPPSRASRRPSMARKVAVEEGAGVAVATAKEARRVEAGALAAAVAVAAATGEGAAAAAAAAATGEGVAVPAAVGAGMEVKATADGVVAAMATAAVAASTGAVVVATSFRTLARPRRRPMSTPKPMGSHQG